MTMSAKAAGAYLWELRKHRRLSREEAAAELHTVRSHIERMEYGLGDTLAPMYMAYVRLVGGDFDHVADLLLDEKAKAEQGTQKAKEWLAQGKREDFVRIAASLTPVQLEQSVEGIRVLRKGLEALGHVVIGEEISEADARLLASLLLVEEISDLFDIRSSVTPEKREQIIATLRGLQPDSEETYRLLKARLDKLGEEPTEPE